MCQLDRLHSLRREIYEIARKHKADKVYVFGSCARKEETPAATSIPLRNSDRIPPCSISAGCSTTCRNSSDAKST